MNTAGKYVLQFQDRYIVTADICVLTIPFTLLRRVNLTELNLPSWKTNAIQNLGYGTVNGFRASTSQSFLWYDLGREETTSLRIHPLAWMDANAYYESKLNAEAAAADFLHYQKIIQKFGGTFIAVAHNHLIAAADEWKNWPVTYHALLSKDRTE